MDEILGLAVVLITILLVLAAAIEAVLEVLRGFTGKLIPSLKGAVSLDEALKQAREFAEPGSEQEARLIAIKAAADRINHTIKTDLAKLDSAAAAAVAAVGTSGNSVTQVMNMAADEVAAAIGEYERHRILILRVLSAFLGVGFSFLSRVDLLDLLGATRGFETLRLADGPLHWVGEVVTGVAAASGSSFWHDKLDRVRSLKNINQQLAALMR